MFSPPLFLFAPSSEKMDRDKANATSDGRLTFAAQRTPILAQ